MAVSISLSITQNSQSVENNTSNVTVKVTVKWTYGSYNATGLCAGSITIDGTKYSFSGIKFNTGQSTSGSQTIMTKKVDVTHNDDGSKKLSCSASFDSRVSSGTVTASGSKELTTIPRKSTLKLAPGTLGTLHTMTIAEKASSFKHKLEYTCGSASGWIMNSSNTFLTTNSVSWTPPLTLAQQNKTGDSVSVTFTLHTYTDDGALVGSSAHTTTFSIPASVKPSVSIAVSDPMGYATKYGSYVQGKSKMKIVATASGSQGSTIKSYKTVADGNTYTKASVESDVIVGTGTLTIKTNVADSRGRTASDETTISVLAYNYPKISALAVYRCDATGKASSSGEYLAVKFSSVITSLNSKNTAVYTVQYKKEKETSYTTKTLSDFSGKYSVSNGVYVFPAETTSSYDIILTVKDDFKSVEKSGIGSSVKKVWSLLKKAGEIVGIALGKIAELEGVFDVAFVTRIREHLNVGNKTGHLDGKTGVFISKEGYIQIQRDSSAGYHPYISFFHDDADYHAGMIRQNCSTKKMDFTGAEGYNFDSDSFVSGNAYFGTTNSWEDSKSGVRLSKSGGLQIQRTADSSPYIDMFFNGSATYDSRIVHTLATKYMNFYGAGRYVFDNTVEAPTLFSKGHVRIGSDGFESENNVIQTYWKDASVHNLVERSDDGLTTAVGWAGSADYATVTKIRGRTCQYQNASGTTALSDERLKKDFIDLEKWSKFFDALEPCAFKMKSGSSGRFHVGFKAQQVEQALAEAGLTTQDFAGFIKMPYIPDADDPEGSAIYAEAGIQPGDDSYGLIYSEFVALNTFKVQKLQNEVDLLKRELAELKELLKNQ